MRGRPAETRSPAPYAPISRTLFPGSILSRDANVLVFPDLDAASIAYKLMITLGGTDGFGPIIMGMRKPLNVLAQGSSVDDIVHMAAITVVKAQTNGGL